MSFEPTLWFFNPFVLLFGAVVTGLLLGRVRYGRVRLGTSGPLFTGLLLGWLAVHFAGRVPPDTPGHDAVEALLSGSMVPRELFTLSLVLFIASVGLLAARDIDVVIRRYGPRFILLGCVITLTGALASYGMVFLFPGLDPYAVPGVYTGSLTSSPGLAAALESNREVAVGRLRDFGRAGDGERERIGAVIAPGEHPPAPDELDELAKERYLAHAESAAGAGYVVAYPFGVLIVILFVTLAPRVLGIDIEREKRQYIREMRTVRAGEAAAGEEGEPEGGFDPAGFALVCLLGYTLGMVGFHAGPLGSLRLGTTGGVLFAALLLGHWGGRCGIGFRMDPAPLEAIRKFSITMFLGIIGLNYGYQVFAAEPAMIAMALLVGLSSLTAGLLVGRHLFQINWIMLSGAVCGGMTSTPGLGAAIDALGSDDPAAGYGATYPFALLGMVILATLLSRVLL